MNTVEVQVIIPEIQIDFDTVREAQAMAKYCRDMKLQCIVTENPIMLSVYDVPETALGKIRRYCALNNFTKSTVKCINKAHDMVIGTADIMANKVAAPIVQASIKAGAGIGKVAAKATLATGATLIGSVVENCRKTGLELKEDPEVIHAKEELSGAFKAIKGAFGFGGNSSKNDRIRVMQ